MTPKTYFRATREPRYSLLFVLPLLLLYEGLAMLLSHSAYAGVRNGADVLLKTLFLSLGGRYGLLVFGMLLLGVGGVLVVRDIRQSGAPIGKVFGWMTIESLFYAGILGGVVASLTSLLLEHSLVAAPTQAVQQMGLGSQLMLSLGAGIYEELLFRVLLVSGLILLLSRTGLSRGWSATLAVVLAALIFSGFHYVGPYGDPLDIRSFTFRAVAGLLLSGLYVARGFGIVAWSHALYDVGIFLAS